MKLDDVKKLQQKKYREVFQHFLVEGEHLVLELQKAATIMPSLKQSEIYVTEKYASWLSDFKTHVVSDKQMAQISDTKTPQGILAVVPFLSETSANKKTKENTNKERAVYLHEVQDPGNLGTILRTLAWFGNFRLLLSPNSVDPYNPKVVRSSMGATFHVAIEENTSLESLNDRFENIAYLDMQGTEITDESFKSFDCYLFGNEARGVPRENLTQMNAQAFTIKGSGAIESLNLASAVNISAYEISH